jgi:fluoride ion exporter CrcB/FEX
LLVGFWISVLIIMNIYDASIRSLIIVGFVGSNATISTLIVYYGHRLDVGRAYLEQAVSAIAKEPLF